MEASNCSMNPSASEMRDSQHSSDMVERVARALCAANFKQQGAEGEFGTEDECWFAWIAEARAALEASHHVDLVELLGQTRWYVNDSLNAHFNDETSSLLRDTDALLAKIGGDA